jgi:pimeloyl-ACP methyl ester carboxylesterase
MRTRRLPAGPVGLEVSEAGDGGRPLLLLHGFTGTKEDFADFLDPLAGQGWHAVAPDLRGHGASDHPEAQDEYSLAVFTTDVLALADALAWERFALLGHSMGGKVAQEVVLAAPDRVAALVLMGTWHGPLEGYDPETVALGSAIVRDEGMPRLLELQTRQRESDPLVSPSFLRVLDQREGYAEFCERKFLAASPEMWLAMVPQFLSSGDRLEELGHLAVPTLVLVGEEDRLFLGPCRRLAEAIPTARLAVLPDAGHSPQFENPDAWYEALDGFLRTVDERPEEGRQGVPVAR